ncbi:MAG: hypothetical protein V2I97_23040 [Desulfococcaceae bacterium]|nr:hypothetical protein [Desulfococcaceae bacterium]
MPSASVSESTCRAIDSISIAVPPSNACASGVMQSGQFLGQPRTHRAKRRYGPSARVQGRMAYI